MTPDNLYRYFQDARSIMRNQLLPCFPKDLHKLQSGKGFHEVCNDVILKQSRLHLSSLKKNQMSQQEIDASYPSESWQYTTKPWKFSLAVKVFRKSPELASNVAEVLANAENKPISRAELLQQKAQESTKKLSPWNSLSSSSYHAQKENAMKVEHNREKRRKLESETRRAAINLSICLGKVQELKETLAILKDIRPVIGEADYNEQVKALFSNLPNVSSYNIELCPIEVDNERDDII